MNKQRVTLSDLLLVFVATGVLAGLYLASRYNFLLFHVFAELFSIVIAFGIFLFAWNTRKIIDNNYLLFIGIAYLFVGFFDTLHTLSYKGMGLFHGGSSNLATQLWVSARLLESASLLLAPLVFRRMPRTRFLLSIYIAVTALLVSAIFYTHSFPVCYIDAPGLGLTPFKIAIEYVICVLLVVSLFLLFHARSQFETRVFNLLIASIGVTIASELVFTLYTGVYGTANLIGHYLKIVSFYLIYKAIMETGLMRPYSFLFRQLKQHENELLQRAEIIDQSHDSIVTTDAKRCVASWNKGAERMFGYTAEEAIGRDVSFIYAGKAPELVHKETMRVLEEKGEYEFETPMRRKSGEDFWAHVSLSLLRPAESQSHGTIKYILDVTARKDAEEGLKAEKEFTETALNAQTDTFFVFDPATGTALRWNKAFNDMSGYSDEEIRTMRAPDSYYGEEDLKKAALATERLLKEGEASVELSLIAKDGRSIPTEYIASTIKDEAGQPKYIIAIGRDIAERKQAEEERRRLEKLKDEFVRMASHDLKNPLMSIGGLANLVRELCVPGEPMTEEAAECMDRIGKSVDVMYNIILNFLDFHALEDGRISIRAERVSLNSIAQQVVESNAENAKRKNTTLELNAEPAIPPVSADPYRLHQVVDNLVNNAIKFSPKGSRVFVSTQLEDGDVRLEVADSGPGLREEDMHRAFMKYTRLSSKPTGGEKGSGLGLAICKHLVELHQGKIGVKNNPEKGCTFWFSLPACTEKHPTRPGRSRRTHSRASQSAEDPRKD